MSFTAPPNLTDYMTFIRNEMGITADQLPDASPVIQTSLDVAVAIVSTWLCQISSLIYVLAVYNLAGDRLLNFAPDNAAATIPADQTYFSALRTSYGINSFVAGVIQSSGDEGTNESWLVPDSLKGLTLMDLQNLKTPYGRVYLQFAQQLGPVWGLS